MHYIDDATRHALEQLAEKYGSRAELARRLGVSAGMVSKWLSGKSEAIAGVTWRRIESQLKPHIRPVCFHGLTEEECLLSENVYLRQLLDNILAAPSGMLPEEWYAALNAAVSRERDRLVWGEGEQRGTPETSTGKAGD